MKNWLTVLAVVLLLAGVVHGKQDDSNVGQNLLRGNNSLSIYQENEQGIPVYVQGEFARDVAWGNEVATALDFFETYKSAYGMSDPSTELSLRRMEVDKNGMRHVRLSQVYNGLPVIGGELVAHYTFDGTMKTVNGHYVPDIRVETTPQFPHKDAVIVAQDDLERIAESSGQLTGDVELVVFPWEKSNYLCWRFFLYSDTPVGRWEYFVDARTGLVVFRANRIMDAEAIGTGTGVMGNQYNHIDTWYTGSQYEMRDYTRQANNDIHGHGGQMPDGNYIQTNVAGSSLPGSIATDADNVWGGTTYAPAVDGHMYTSLFYDWLLREMGRNGYDDNGHSMLTIVNYSGDGDNNAYWDGSRIVVWSWGTGWRSLAGCPDVISHEWGHAVTEYTSNLVYQLEPGALNESFSDMIGAAFEWAHDTLDVPDWLMGENGQTSGDGFRSMENPHEFGDPDFYGTTDPYWVDVVGCSPSWFNDYCGVHTNSGVGNKWFFLLSDGGSHHGVTVTGIGPANAIQIAYHANAYYWTSSSQYSDAAAATVSAAYDLDPTGAWAVQTAAAWNAVGVDAPGPSVQFDYPDGIPLYVAPGQDTTFEVVVAGFLGGEPIAGTGQIYLALNGRFPVPAPMTEISPNHYLAELPALECGDLLEYYFSVDMTPTATIYDPNPSEPYTLTAATGVINAFEDDFETDQGWTISGGSWARGVPTGGGGSHGNPDPTSGVVGSSVMGYNLSGDYTNNMPERHVTSPAIDCSELNAVRLKFWRWLGVEQPLYDHAYVRVSTNGTSWTTIWENESEIADDAWTEMDFDLSSIADGQPTVYVRFTMGSTDGGWTYCGWNVDHVRVTGTECVQTELTITTASLPSWTVDYPYSQQLEAVGGDGTLTWTDKDGTLSGTGLSLSGSGLVSGTPTSVGPISFTALVEDGMGGSDEKPFNFTINAAVEITTSGLPDWTQGFAYSSQLAATGGTGARTWSDKNGDLSGTGLSLSANGLLSGTPSGTGPISFTALVTDGIGAEDETVLGFTVNPAVAITPSALPDWDVGLAFSQQLVAGGGTGILTWNDMNGDLAGTGLTLSSAGLLSGTPTSPGLIEFTARAIDDVGASDQQQFSFTVNAAPSIVTETIGDWTVGQAYSNPLSATGGTGTKTWSDKNGDLASTGLTLSADGLLSGVPNASGPISFVAMITDDLGVTDEQALACTINPAVDLTTETLPDSPADEFYSVQLEATGGTGMLTFVDKNGDLAGTGLSLSTDGLLSGTPTGVMTVSFTALVSDMTGSSDEAAYVFDLTQWYVCGDIDGNGEGPDITDIIYLVEYSFNDGPPPPTTVAADVDGSGELDVADLIYLVDFSFGDPPGPEPVCEGKGAFLTK